MALSIDVLSNLKMYNLQSEFENLILKVKSNLETQICIKKFQDALDNPKKLISESEAANGVVSSTMTKNLMMFRQEV